MAENTKTFVIDASYVLSFLLPSENTPEAENLFNQFQQQKISLIAPILLSYEIANALKTNVMRKKISGKQAHNLLSAFKLLNIKQEPIHFKDILKTAIDNNVSAYDASYLVLAKKKRVKLLTLDRKLKQLILKPGFK